MSFLLKDQAYDKLVQLINQGKLKYGETYSLNALAQDLEMSRTPVRDAIQKLADENRIDVLPSRGIRLHQMTVEEITQHYHFSTAIEGYCAASLANAYQEDNKRPYLQKMQELLTSMWTLADSDQAFGEFFSLDQQFHRELLESLGDPYFSSLEDSPMGFTVTRSSNSLRGKSLERTSVNAIRTFWTPLVQGIRKRPIDV